MLQGYKVQIEIKSCSIQIPVNVRYNKITESWISNKPKYNFTLSEN